MADVSINARTLWVALCVSAMMDTSSILWIHPSVLTLMSVLRECLPASTASIHQEGKKMAVSSKAKPEGGFHLSNLVPSYSLHRKHLAKSA